MFTITSHFNIDKLLHLRKSMTFYCPQCENPVRLKIGQVMIPHFAHIVLSDCLSTFSERETPLHLNGKLQLSEFLHDRGCDVFVECYLPQIHQRPDILVEINHQPYAIEFQCSTMPIPLRDTRNQGYKQLSIEPVWILRSFDCSDEPVHGIVPIQLTHFRQAFIHHTEDQGSWIMSYDPNTKQFIYYSHLMHLQGTRFIAKIRKLPIQAQSFPFRQVKPLIKMERMVYWRIFQHHRARFLRNRLLTSRKGVNDPFLRTCYVNHIQPENLPLFIGVPILSAKNVSTGLIEWQLGFIHMCMEHSWQFEEITNAHIDSFTCAHLRECDVETARELCLSYIYILRQLPLKVDASLLKQKVAEEQLLEIFLQLKVAKPTEY